MRAALFSCHSYWWLGGLLGCQQKPQQVLESSFNSSAPWVSQDFCSAFQHPSRYLRTSRGAPLLEVKWAVGGSRRQFLTVVRGTCTECAIKCSLLGFEQKQSSWDTDEKLGLPQRSHTFSARSWSLRQWSSPICSCLFAVGSGLVDWGQRQELLSQEVLISSKSFKSANSHNL